MSAVDTPILVTPVVSWPRLARPGNRYLVTVDLRRTRPADDWPYDEEEFTFACAVDGGRYFTVACVGETSLVLHRFGGTYGPVRFIVKAERIEAPASTALWLTLSTEGGVALPAVELPVRVDADAEDRPEDMVGMLPEPGGGAVPESGAGVPSGGPPYLGPAELVEGECCWRRSGVERDRPSVLKSGVQRGPGVPAFGNRRSGRQPDGVAQATGTPAAVA